MDEPVLSALWALLAARTGLDPAATTPLALERTVRARMRTRRICSHAEYLSLVRLDDDELGSLIDEVAVPETWFFRDSGPFELLERWVVGEWLPQRGGRRLHVLSMPCASGEEPYSIAMVLLAAGLPRGSFGIDAVDVSRKALERARRAVYGPQAFRERGWPVPAGHFREVADGQELDPEVRSLVHFTQASAVTWGGDATSRPRYQVIFCRNLLIYLSEEARARLTANLDAMLVPGGLLFLGHAEAPHVFLPAYASEKAPRAFAARKPLQGEPRPEATPRTPTPARAETGPRTVPAPVGTPAPAPGRRHRDTPATHGRPGPEPAPAQPSATDTDKPLEQAERLADSGDLEGAAALCRELLEAAPMSAPAHHLLGVIAHARGDDTAAEQHLRKALFLDPRHLPSLVQLKLVLAGSGRRTEEVAIQERIHRLGAPA